MGTRIGKLLEDGYGGISSAGVMPTPAIGALKIAMDKAIFNKAKKVDEQEDGETIEFKVTEEMLREVAKDYGVDEEQLIMGYEIEKEHTESIIILSRLLCLLYNINKSEDRDHKIRIITKIAPIFITLDHLKENSLYYTKLKKMETNI
jgi:hypothetical protein